jgi:hypothetical protein
MPYAEGALGERRYSKRGIPVKEEQCTDADHAADATLTYHEKIISSWPVSYTFSSFLFLPIYCPITFHKW